MKKITNNKYPITNTKYYSKGKQSDSIGHLTFGIRHLKFQSAFTLIELLIVIAIIAILISAGIYSWTSAQQKGRDNRRKSDLKAIQQSLENFFQTNGRYPPTSSPGDWCDRISDSAKPEVKNSLEPAYAAKLPQDPLYAGKTNDYYYYLVAGGVNKYNLYSTLENSKDQEYVTDALGADGLVGGCTNANANYHYKVTNY